MTMGPEAKLWKSLKPHLEAAGCLCTRIENRHGGGLPDVDVSSPVGAFKIELKVSAKNSVGLSDMQIAYNTLLSCKHGLSFILAEDQGRSKPCTSVQDSDDLGSLFKKRGSGTTDLGRGTDSRGQSGRVGSGRGQLGRVGARYYLWSGAEAVDVGRSGLRHEAVASGDSLPALVEVMLAACRVHHLALLGKDPGH